MAQDAVGEKPRVRAITAFVRLDDVRHRQPIDEALAVLRAAKAEFEKRGYEVQTLRMVTQPLAQLIAGKSEAAALDYLKWFDDLSAQEKFMPDVGPAMLLDSDDPKSMHLLGLALSRLPNINASAIVAADDGIHWKAIQSTARLIRYLADNSPRSQGNFNFTATAMLKPYGPFFPGTYHTGAGRQLSMALKEPMWFKPYLQGPTAISMPRSPS